MSVDVYAERTSCGWCHQLVHWPSEGQFHAYGTCVDGPDAAAKRRFAQEGPKKGRQTPVAPPEVKPTTTLEITWAEGVSGEDIRRISRSWAAQLSEKKAAAEVHVKTYGTVA